MRFFTFSQGLLFYNVFCHCCGSFFFFSPSQLKFKPASHSISFKPTPTKTDKYNDMLVDRWQMGYWKVTSWQVGCFHDIPAHILISSLWEISYLMLHTDPVDVDQTRKKQLPGSLLYVWCWKVYWLNLLHSCWKTWKYSLSTLTGLTHWLFAHSLLSYHTYTLYTPPCYLAATTLRKVL